MPSPVENAANVVLLMPPAIFGLALSCIMAVGVHHCILCRRLKRTYEKRICVTREQLRLRLRQCKVEGISTARQRLRELRFQDLCESSTDDDNQAARDCYRGNKIGSASENPRTPHGLNSTSPSTNGGELGSSFVLDDVSMLDSEEGDSSGSWLSAQLSMHSNTESSGLTEGDRPMPSGASPLHMTEPSGSTASDRYTSAPFLLQIRFSRAAHPTEILAVDTPPSSSRPQLRPQLLPQRLPLGKLGIINVPQQSGMPATIGAARPCEWTPEMSRAAGQQTSSAVARETSVSSMPLASDAYALLANVREPSLSYTWTDSYLDESPSTTKARWMRQRTFGPVVQSEGGGSSTVSSTPRGTCDAEAIWDDVHARNGATESLGDERDREDDRRKWNTAVGGGAQTRRFDLSTANTGEGLSLQRRHRGEDDHFAVDTFEWHATAIAASPRLPVGRLSVSASTSNTSTVIATVQQPLRAGLITPIEKPQHPPTAEAAINAADGMEIGSARGKKGAASSPAAAALFHGVNLSSASRNVAPASRAFSPRRTVSIAVTSNAQTSRPPSANPGLCESNSMGSNTSPIGQRCHHLKASRCSPQRGRVLKALYED